MPTATDLTTSNSKFSYVLTLLYLVQELTSNLHFRNLPPSEHKPVSLLTLGEGWHNYHHTFPWDYKTSELGDYGFNFTNAFIDFFAWIGWAYDLKSVSKEMVQARVRRTGDGTHELWGWGDKDITKEDKEATIISHKES